MRKNTLKRENNISSLGIHHKVKDLQWFAHNLFPNRSQLTNMSNECRGIFLVYLFVIVCIRVLLIIFKVFI